MDMNVAMLARSLEVGAPLGAAASTTTPRLHRSHRSGTASVESVRVADRPAGHVGLPVDDQRDDHDRGARTAARARAGPPRHEAGPVKSPRTCVLRDTDEPSSRDDDDVPGIKVGYA